MSVSATEHVVVVQSGIEFPVNSLHHRELFHPCGKGLVGLREQPRALNGDSGIGSRGHQQAFIVLIKRYAITPIEQFDDTDDVPV